MTRAEMDAEASQIIDRLDELRRMTPSDDDLLAWFDPIPQAASEIALQRDAQATRGEVERLSAECLEARRYLSGEGLAKLGWIR